MSVQAISYVLENSPYKGATFIVHIIIADAVNGQNDNKFWMSYGTTATKARITRRAAITAIQTMVKDGLLELVEKRDNNSNIFRFIFMGGELVSPGGEQITPEVVNTVPVGGEHSTPKPNTNPKITQGENLESQAQVIYLEYPRQVAKKKALVAIRESLKRAKDFNKVLARTKLFAELTAEREREFIPHPTTWFNQDRYNDDPDEWMTTADRDAREEKLRHELKFETDMKKRETILEQLKAVSR